jgi:hypothetical protein
LFLKQIDLDRSQILLYNGEQVNTSDTSGWPPKRQTKLLTPPFKGKYMTGMQIALKILGGICTYFVTYYTAIGIASKVGNEPLLLSQRILITVFTALLVLGAILL